VFISGKFPCFFFCVFSVFQVSVLFLFFVFGCVSTKTNSAIDCLEGLTCISEMSHVSTRLGRSTSLTPLVFCSTCMMSSNKQTFIRLWQPLTKAGLHGKVVKNVHVRYLISWWASCPSLSRSCSFPSILPVITSFMPHRKLAAECIMLSVRPSVRPSVRDYGPIQRVRKHDILHTACGNFTKFTTSQRRKQGRGRGVLGCQNTPSAEV